MKIVWLCNGMPLNEIVCGEYRISGGISWISSSLESWYKRNEDKIYVLFPQCEARESLWCEIENVQFIGFYQDKKWPWERSEKVVELFNAILEEIQPDIIQIWGTEYAHSVDMVSAAGERYKDHIVVHIQGLISVYARYYMADLPWQIRCGFTFRDFFRGDNIWMQQRKYALRGKNEIELLRKVNHVMGRTDWDNAHCLAINPTLNYYYCNETMRKEFGERAWSIGTIERYTIFITQGGYPIKGFHYFLEALKILVKKFPQLRVRVAGRCVLLDEKARIRESSYNRYVRKYIVMNKLEQYIDFLGYQDAQGMVREFSRANVYVLPSAVENSPNSLAEAMLVGTPAVVADVGGVRSMMEHGKEGFIYPHNDPVLLAHYIERLFLDVKLSEEMASCERKRANSDYDVKKNMDYQLEIYKELSYNNAK